MWLKTLGPRTFTRDFADFHVEFWDWYWPITLKRKRGERLDIEDLICLYILGRGSGKSANVEWACIAEGALLGTGYVLYFCATESQARDHLIAIKSRLESPEIEKYYPGLANPDIGKHGFRRGWSQDYLATRSGWGIVPAGLDVGIRGGRKDDMRFTLEIADDIDDFTDSAAVSLKKLNSLSRSIVPAGTEDTIVLFPQNIIHENSVMNQIVTRRSDVFSIRKTIGPHPSFKVIELELTDREDGAKVWDIKSCEPNWEALDLQSARKFLSKSGRAAFLAEYQHDFSAAREGRVLRNWDDSLMTITEDQFAGVFGSYGAIQGFNKIVGHDFARTKSAYHAPVMGKLAISNQNTRLPGKLFLHDLMTFDAGTVAEDMGRRLLKSISRGPIGRSESWDDLIEASLSRAGLERYIKEISALIKARREVLTQIIPPLVAPILEAKRYGKFVGSHEQNNDALDILRTVYGLPFHPVNPGEMGGIEWADHYMTVDKKTRHPFLEDEQLADGTWALGCPGFFVVVPNDKAAYPSSLTPESLVDSDFWRYSFDHWLMRPMKLTEAGQIEFGPMKMWDDPGNCLQMMLVGNEIANFPLVYAEMVEAAMQPKHRELLTEVGLQPEQELELLFAIERAKHQIDDGGIESFDEWGNRQ